MIKEFDNEFQFLSNFYPCVVSYNGITYTSVEHAYQAQKNLSKEWQEFCVKEESPSKVKRASRKIKIRDDWEQVKLQIMKELVQIKFENSFMLTLKLVVIGNQNIQEGNWHHDTFWGIDLETGIGENHLGRILMSMVEKFSKIKKFKN